MVYCTKRIGGKENIERFQEALRQEAEHHPYADVLKGIALQCTDKSTISYGEFNVILKGKPLSARITALKLFDYHVTNRTLDHRLA